jgi:ABC-type multidrug transport system fused ATPase/permease subunit
VKVFAHLFQKVAGTGRARKTAFLFDSFFFVPCTVKEKAAMEHCESERRSVMTIKITNRPTCAKEICFSLFKKTTVFAAICIVFFIAVGLLLLLTDTEGDSRVQGISYFFAALVIFLIYALRMRAVIKQFSCSISRICDQTPIQYLTFDKRIISERRVGDEIVHKIVIEYSNIKKAWETKNLILIETCSNQYITLPKCDLTEAEQTDVKRLLVTVGVPCRFKKS